MFRIAIANGCAPGSSDPSRKIRDDSIAPTAGSSVHGNNMVLITQNELLAGVRGKNIPNAEADTHRRTSPWNTALILKDGVRRPTGPPESQLQDRAIRHQDTQFAAGMLRIKITEGNRRH